MLPTQWSRMRHTQQTMKLESMGISKLKSLTYKDLRELKDILVVEEFTNRPVVAIVPWRDLLRMQYLIIKADQLLEGKLEK